METFICKNEFSGDAATVLLELARQLERELAGQQGYVDAFYAIGKALCIPALPMTPQRAFETRILPLIQELAAMKVKP